MLTRIGDTAQSDRVLSAMQATNARIRAGQIEVSTGKRAARFDEIGGEVGVLLRSREQRARAEAHVQQNEQVLDRLKAMDGALANLGDIAQRARTLLTHRLDSASGALVPLDREAATLLSEAASQLNLRLDERYLFAGSRADAPPVSLPDPPPTAAAPTTYYKGDAVVQSVRADRDVEIPYSLTADNPAFAKLIGALGKTQEAHVANDREGLRTALDMMDAAVGELAELRGETGATSARLEVIAEGQRRSMLYLDEIVSRIEDTNVPEAMTRIVQDQGTLEAAYMTVSRLSRLSLADYLR